MKDAEELIIPGESYMEAALRHLQAGDFTSAREVSLIQEGIQVRYERVFLTIPEQIKNSAQDKIHGIGGLRSSDIAILAAFYSADSAESLGGVFKSVSFLQNMTQFGGAKALYKKDASIKSRIVRNLCNKYSRISEDQEELMKIIDGEFDIIASFYPNPYRDGIENDAKKAELRDYYEYLLFREVKRFLFPNLFQEESQNLTSSNP